MTKEEMDFHKSRRKEFLRLIGKDSAAIIFGNTLHKKSFDSEYQFKQFKNFYYLTGFTEPNSALLMTSAGINPGQNDNEKNLKEILFVQKKDPLMETWNGKRLGYENVKKITGIKTGRENTELKKILNWRIFSQHRKLYINIAEMMMISGEMKEIVSSFLNSINVWAAEIEIIDASFILGKMRAVKTQFEVKQIQNACNITGNSYKETMKIIRPEMNEYQVQSTLEYYYKFNGSQDNAYYPIVAGGDNACILHYDSNNRILKNGELLLIDSGAEYNYYSSDVTRTFPVNGKFSEAQKLIYEIVLRANKECIRKIKPGIKLSELKILSERVLGDGLNKAGLLKNKKEIKKYSIHGVGHHMGLDTHDALPSSKTVTEDNDSLKPGNVITIEPGLYFPEGTKGIQKKFLGIGVRIEDDILVTKNGCVNLTKGIVKEISEIEAEMRV